MLFHRFDLMRDWVHEDGATAIALLNTCLGATLARFVLNGAAMK